MEHGRFHPSGLLLGQFCCLSPTRLATQCLQTPTEILRKPIVQSRFRDSKNTNDILRFFPGLCDSQNGMNADSLLGVLVELAPVNPLLQPLMTTSPRSLRLYNYRGVKTPELNGWGSK
jgi:hypothetical protein